MEPAQPQVRISFQLKVLLPVLGALILLPAVTLWIVNGYISRQMQDEAQQSLSTTRGVFEQLLEWRSRDLLSRFRSAANESSYRSLAPLVAAQEPSARETIRKFLNERLDAYGEDCEALLLVAQSGANPAVARRGSAFSADEFVQATAGLTALAQQGEPVSGPLNLNGHSYLVAAVPIATQENAAPVGVLTVATRLGERSLQELKAITGTDIVLLEDRTVTAATIRQPELPTALLTAAGNGPTNPRLLPVVNDHYLALAGSYSSGNATRGFTYVLLSSFEQRLAELA